MTEYILSAAGMEGDRGMKIRSTAFGLQQVPLPSGLSRYRCTVVYGKTLYYFHRFGLSAC